MKFARMHWCLHRLLLIRLLCIITILQKYITLCCSILSIHNSDNDEAFFNNICFRLWSSSRQILSCAWWNDILRLDTEMGCLQGIQCISHVRNVLEIISLQPVLWTHWQCPCVRFLMKCISTPKFHITTFRSTAFEVRKARWIT